MADIKCEVLKTINEIESRRGGKIRLRIVKWGNSKNTVLEKREFWYNEEGEEKLGRAKGLNSDDLRIIIDNIDEIEKIMT